MKAVVYRKGIGLVAETRPVPAIAADQVLIRVSNTGFCGSDHTLVESGGLPDGYVLGHETSGTVAEIGTAVDGVAAGSQVILRPSFCGACRDCAAGRPYFCANNRRSIGVGDLPGAFAEYVAAYPGMLIPVPQGVDSRNAALAEAFAASLHGIRCSRSRGGSVLVIGGGPIGLALVRLLKILSFGPVVLAEPVAHKRHLAQVFGADAAYDPLTGKTGLHVLEWTGGAGFETVFECSGSADAVQGAMDAACKGGTVCVVSVRFQPVRIVPVTLNFKEIWLTGAYSNTREENIRCLEWMGEGVLDGRPLISDLIPLEELPRVYRESIQPEKTVKVMARIGPEF